ncbi:MAG: phosphomethylpyrimidine synthase ThiC [Candidatus Omnitrophota bacterium]|nr:MAG: phosphomethylpyrimidine synthase ThiC [Candidatus Omnitrophota bacterium]
MFKKSFLKKIAKQESVAPGYLEKNFKKGKIVIPLNKTKEIKKPTAIGEGLRVKTNTNIGTSTERREVEDELKKLHIAIECGTDTVMDLSVGGNIAKIRREIIQRSTIPVGTVPIYEAALQAERQKMTFEAMSFDTLWDVLVQQAKDGVDFFTIHAGILKKSLKMIQKKKRVGGVVSRGGAILSRWMYVNQRENPLYENFDKILELAKNYNITLSLGDALRPGAIADSTDRLQLSELYVLGELVKRCRKRGVQVMVEGPGHIRLDEIGFNVWLQKRVCNGAPFYILGPLPTDIAAGYDHITASIGGALAALWGADFLCVVTPAEHLRHPSIDDIKDGVIAAKIAAHSVNLLRFKEEWKKDYQISLYRAKRDWQKLFPLTIDEKKARGYRQTTDIASDICTMCGEFCSLKISEHCNLLK